MFHQPFLTTVGGSFEQGTQPSGVRAGTFAASNDGTATNYLTVTNPASMRIGPTDTFIIGGWFKYTSASIGPALMSKGVFGSNGSYAIIIDDDAGDAFLYAQKDDIGGSDSASSPGTLTPDTKTFIFGWIDGTTINIKVNNQIPGTAAHIPLQTADAGGDVYLLSDSGFGLNGVMDEWFFCKNPPDMTAALAIVNSIIYNSGTGAHYDALNDADKTALGLVSWWSLDEASASSRVDSKGTNNLSVNGTVTKVIPLVV